MPKEGISVYFTIKDGASQVLATIGDKTKALDKETQQLAQSQEALRKTNEPLIEKQQALKIALEKSIATVKEAKTAFRTFGDEASEAWDLAGAISEQDELRRALRETEDQIKGNIKAHNEMQESIRKGALRELGGGKEEAGILSQLSKSGLTRLAGDAASQFAGYWVESMLGQPTANLVSSLASGVTSGAAMGMTLGPFGGVPGAMIGAGIGGFSGLLSGVSQVFQAQDDAFKSYVQEQTESALSEQDSLISSGSTIAGGREQTQMAFAQRLGSESAAKDYLDQVKTMAARTNYSYDEITGYSKLLLNSYEADETLGILRTLSDATAGLNLSSSDVNMMISGLSRMRTTGKATQEYLNYFRERGVDVDQALAGDLGVDKSKISDMVSKGQINGVDAAQAILDFIDQEFGGLSDRLAETYDAMVDNLADSEANLQAMAGEGYNEERKKGIEAQQSWLEENENTLGDAYSSIGAWKASLENAKEAYIREAVDEAMGSEEYKTAQAEGDAAEMGRIIMQAKIKGMGEYNENEGRDEVLAQELSLIEGVRSDAALNDGYWEAGYTLGRAFSRGRAAGMAIRLKESGNYLAYADPESSEYDPAKAFLGFSYGLDRVPYDDFPALLHEGERVLTAQEARAQDNAGAPAPIAITITGNSFTGGGEEMAEQLAEVLARKLEQAATAAVPR